MDLETLRHSASHLLAQAVLDIFPEVKLGIGPPTETGFFYEFEREKPFTPEDLEKIEMRMKNLAQQNIPIEKISLPKDEVIKLFSEKNQDLKVELIIEKGDEMVSLYKQGNFIDFCLGPHVPSTNFIKYFKLLYVSGSYWKGDEKGRKLQRIYGTAFLDKKSLEEHLHFLEEAKKRDHRRVGKDLDLFSVRDEIGPGLILWHPKGSIVRKIIEDFWREEHLNNGYELLFTPHIARLELWNTSGHLEYYWENMYPEMKLESDEYELKPMNCPFHIQVYNSKLRSYRELPLRWAELGTVYRYERSGVLHGLMRVRGFTQDDAHLFMREDQLEDEIEKLLVFNLNYLKAFSFQDFEIYLSTRPDRFVGEIKEWEKFTQILKNSLEKLNIKYRIDLGAGVFYGPKIDIKIKDVLGRSWQCSTIQVDFNLPIRFDLTYIGEDGKQNRVIMIHRAIMGSLERFFGILIEHYGGSFPLWLSPYQVEIIPVSEKSLSYAKKIKERFQKEKIRISLSERSEKVGYKIREAETEKIPIMIIVGEKEMKNNTASLRIHKKGDIGKYKIDEIIRWIKKSIKNKTLDLEFRR
ncbi:MAG: threonine--tRNA ligase [Acidobacteriota bacterium]